SAVEVKGFFMGMHDIRRRERTVFPLRVFVPRLGYNKSGEPKPDQITFGVTKPALPEFHLHTLSQWLHFNCFILSHALFFRYSILHSQTAHIISDGAFSDLHILVTFLQPVHHLSTR